MVGKSKKEFKKWQIREEIKQAFREFLTEIGVSEEDLKKMMKDVDKKEQQTIKVDKSIETINQRNAEDKITPKKVIDFFAQEVEEFYPDGKPTNNK